jgi:hypothetical protein
MHAPHGAASPDADSPGAMRHRLSPHGMFPFTDALYTIKSNLLAWNTCAVFGSPLL